MGALEVRLPSMHEVIRRPTDNLIPGVIRPSIIPQMQRFPPGLLEIASLPPQGRKAPIATGKYLGPVLKTGKGHQIPNRVILPNGPATHFAIAYQKESVTLRRGERDRPSVRWISS